MSRTCAKCIFLCSSRPCPVAFPVTCLLVSFLTLQDELLFVGDGMVAPILQWKNPVMLVSFQCYTIRAHMDLNGKLGWCWDAHVLHIETILLHSASLCTKYWIENCKRCPMHWPQQPGFKEAHLWQVQYSWIICAHLHEGLQLRHFPRVHVSLQSVEPEKTLRCKTSTQYHIIIIYSSIISIKTRKCLMQQRD